MHGLWRDVALASRRLRATPIFTTFAVLSLGIGVGVTTAAYSAMYVLGARPSGMRDERRVVRVTATNSVSGASPARLSWADYQDLAGRQRSLEHPVAWSRRAGVLAGRSSSVRVGVEGVSGRYFSTLGIGAALGRTIGPADDRPDAPAVIVLSDVLWRRQFAADPAVVGTAVRFAEQPFHVIGVAPASFRGAAERALGEVAAWVPLAQAARWPGASFDPVRRDARWLQVAGRLRPDLSADDAARDLATIGLRLDDTAPLPLTPARPYQPAIQPPRAWSAAALDQIAGAFDNEAMRIAVGLPLLVLLIACTNLANLVLSRTSSRRHEVAIRGALGASRWRLLREHLVETALLAAAGGLLGALVAHGLLMWAVWTLGEILEALQPGLLLVWHLQPVVLAAAGAAAVVALLAAGVVPALQATRVNVGRSLTIGDPAAAMPRWRWRSNLIALQLGISTALFLITVVCVRFLIFDRADRLQPGLTPVAVAVVSFDEDRSAARVDEIAQQIVEQARRLPNVAAASASAGLQVESYTAAVSPLWTVEVDVPGGPARPEGGLPRHAGLVPATSGLPATLALDVQHGRFVEDADRGHGIAIDARLATTIFGSTNVVGRQLRLRHDRPTPSQTPDETVVTIVGVVSSLPQPARPRRTTQLGHVFVPFAERTSRDDRRGLSRHVVFSARTRSGEATDLAPARRTAIRDVDRDLAVMGAARADRAAGGELAILAPIVAAGFGSLAVLSLVLASAGLYGVLSHVVAKRTREMGLRVALGADPRRLLTLVLRQGLRPVLEGLAIGLGVALVARQALQMTMTGTLSTVNAAWFGAAAGPLIVVGSLAAYLPARRAARVDPNVALREL